MTDGTPPDRDECIEQAYFFRTFRERLGENMAAQDILFRLHEEILTTTRLPMAVEFLAAEVKHTGLLHTGFEKLPHYFTPFQSFLVRQAEEPRTRFTTLGALQVMEQEARYKSETPTHAGLFVFQFESISRNRLGFDDGLRAVEGDPFYPKIWQEYVDVVRRKVGVFDFCDLVYLRSSLYVTDQRRTDPAYEPPVPPLYGDKEGKIAKASRGRDPLFLFAALQRQLNYPEVPKPREKGDLGSKLDLILVKLRDLENRLKLAEGELRGSIDWTQFGKPDILKDEYEK
jgi:hypothetical protein